MSPFGCWLGGSHHRAYPEQGVGVLGDKNESARIQRIDDVRSLYRRIFASNCFDRRAKKPFSLFFKQHDPRSAQHGCATGCAKRERRRALAGAAEGAAAARRAHRPSPPAAPTHARDPHARAQQQADEWRAAHRGANLRRQSTDKVSPDETPPCHRSGHAMVCPAAADPPRHRCATLPCCAQLGVPSSAHCVVAFPQRSSGGMRVRDSKASRGWVAEH
jgi:hypothetical protein